MNWINHHTHSLFSDGHCHPDLYAAYAFAQGYPALGFSDHAPVPFVNGWSMLQDHLPHYLQHLGKLKAQYEGQMAIFSGLEIDFIPGMVSPADSIFQHPDIDYHIGAVHFVDSFPDGTPWQVDGSIAEFTEGLKLIFKNDIRAAVRRYFELIRVMIEESNPDVVAHLDRFRKNNIQNFFFSEKEAWYQNEVEKTLHTMARHQTILEVNTKSIYRNQSDQPYPSVWILEMAKQMNIRVHPASDAHHPLDIAAGFEEATEWIIHAGYQDITVFSQAGWVSQSLTKPQALSRGRVMV